MVFVRNWFKMPADPYFPPDLEKLGFRINVKGQIVHSETGKLYEYFISDNERVNEVHKEAVRECTREVLTKDLEQYQVKELFLEGVDGAKIQELKPPNDHVKIYVTDPDILKLKSDVVVIVPERSQELGVWNYRHVLTDGGIVSGTALGLVEKLQETNLRDGQDATKEECRAVLGRKLADADYAQMLATHEEWPDKLKERVRISEAGVKGLTTEEVESAVVVPGVVILNPGQLIYSWKMEKSVSVNTWKAQSQDHAEADQFETRPEFDHKPGDLRDPCEGHEDGSFAVRLDWSKVPGHGSAQEHVETVLERVLPQLVPDNTRIWIVGISDGAEMLVNYMEAKLTEPGRDKIIPGRKVKAIALMNSTHWSDNVSSP